MNPQQYGDYPPAPQSNPYDFITAAPQKPQRSSGGISGNSFVGKLVVIIGGAIIFMVVAAFIVNIMFGGKTNVASLIGIVQTQQEIIRVSKLSNQGLSDQSIAGTNVNTRLVIATQQQNMITYMASQGKKVGKKEMDLKKDANTDKQLSQAKATSTFDTVFAQVQTQQLKDYSAALKTAYNNTSAKEMRTLLAKDYNETQTLLKQWPSQ